MSFLRKLFGPDEPPKARWFRCFTCHLETVGEHGPMPCPRCLTEWLKAQGVPFLQLVAPERQPDQPC